MTRTKKGTFAKGTSGNPSGRPRRTDAEKAMLAEIYQLAPLAVHRIRALLEAEDTPPNVALRCSELVLERVAGRAMTLAQIDVYESQPRAVQSYAALEQAFDNMMQERGRPDNTLIAGGINL